MPSEPVAIIVGSAGQDGRLLGELLLSRGQQVVGVTRQTLDITDRSAVDALVRAHRGVHIYYLAADHGSSMRSSANRSTDALLTDPTGAAHRAWATHVVGLIHFCEAMRRNSSFGRLFYASSSRVFGDGADAPLDADGAGLVDETTPHRPIDLYGITKSAGMSVCEMYRRQGLCCSSGILFNHESPLRGESFITQLLARAAAQVKAGGQTKLTTVGRLSARTDWGWAPEYVEAMTRVLATTPGDFVIASGKTHRVQDFAEAAFASVGLDWRDHVEELATQVGAARPALAGNAGKLKAITGWSASKSLQAIAGEMVVAARLSLPASVEKR